MCWYSTSQFQITLNFPQLSALSSAGASAGEQGQEQDLQSTTFTMLRLEANVERQQVTVGGGKGSNASNQSHTFQLAHFSPPTHPLNLIFSLGCIFQHVKAEVVCFLQYLLIYSTGILLSSKPLLLKDNIFLQLSTSVKTHTGDLNCYFKASHIQEKSLRDTDKALLVFTTMLR